MAGDPKQDPWSEPYEHDFDALEFEYWQLVPLAIVAMALGAGRHLGDALTSARRRAATTMDAVKRAARA